MQVQKMLRVINKGKLKRYYCKIDNKLLAEIYDNGEGIPHVPCKHFELKISQQDEQTNAVLKFFNGSTFYLYISKS